MKRDSIKIHLRPYSIYGRRVTTINHAFASAIAVNDVYDDDLITQAIHDLGQDPDGDLQCAYCDARPAETWDHVNGLVLNSRYSGYGHTIGNLLPCCKECNSRKGNRNWKIFLRNEIKDNVLFARKVDQLESYFENHHIPQFSQESIAELMPEEMQAYNEIHQQVLVLMKRADDLAKKIRDKTQKYLK